MALRSRFLRDGALWPVDVLSTGAAQALGRRLLADARRSGGGAFKANDHLYYKAHLIFDAVDELARMPSIVETARSLLQSDDLLLWDASVPIKPPGGPMFPLHQDATYWGLEPPDGALTCWVALSEATAQHGCMTVVRGSHAQGQLPHHLSPSDSSMLRRGQQVAAAEGEAAEDVALSPGQMSVHHPLLVHGSGANVTQEDRIGVVLNYLAPQTRPAGGATGSATLIAGACDVGHWRLTAHRPGPDCTAETSERAHREALATHRGELLARK